MNDVLGFLLGILLGVLLMTLVIPLVRPSWVDIGRKQAVACAPGVFVEETSNGRLICSGGRGEMWAVKP